MGKTSKTAVKKDVLKNVDNNSEDDRKLAKVMNTVNKKNNAKSESRSTASKAASKVNPWMNFLKEYRSTHSSIGTEGKTLFKNASERYRQLSEEAKAAYAVASSD